VTGKICFVLACLLWLITGHKLGAQTPPNEIVWSALLALFNTVCALKLLQEAP
jgi:hypothetical protein